MMHRILPGAILLAALLALFLQEFIRELLIVPAIYLFWALGLFLRSIPQAIYWSLLVAGLALAALGSLFRRFQIERPKQEEFLSNQGPVEELAENIRDTSHSLFVKWMVANQLGRLAQAMLNQRDEKEAGSHPEQASENWDPPAEIRAYLDAGLNRSFVHYPRRKFFSRPPSTPFDLDLDEVIEYLETQMEKRSEP